MGPKIVQNNDDSSLVEFGLLCDNVNFFPNTLYEIYLDVLVIGEV